MIFDNVQLLGYKHENKFFGEKSISYASVKSFSIKGYILDLTNTNGVTNILNNVVTLTKEGKSFQDIVINSENFGIGKIKSFNVDAGNWVRTTQYSAEIEVLSEALLQNVSSSEFNNLSLNDKNLKLLKSLSENFSIDFDTQSKILGGDHSIDIEYDANNVNIDVIKLAQTLASELLSKTIPTSLSEANYTTRSTYRVFNSENYNIIDGKCGFKRNFSYSTENTDKPYSVNLKQSIDLSAEGIATVKESCEIKAESSKPSLYLNALQGLNEQILNAPTRCTSLFNNYKTKFGITTALNTHPINKDIKINKFNGTISYDITYDNDIKKANPTYSWERTQTIDRGEDGIWSASEEGSINGVGQTGETQKYTNAETGWTTVKGEIYTRVNSFYTNYATSKSGSGLKQKTKTINRAPYNATISYTYSYTDDPKIQIAGDVTRIDIEVSDTGLGPIVKNFVIPNNKYTLLQNRNFSNQGTFTVSVKMEIGCISNTFNGLDWFSTARSKAGFGTRASAGFSPTAKDYYLESINYTSDEIEKTVSYEEVYKYS